MSFSVFFGLFFVDLVNLSLGHFVHHVVRSLVGDKTNTIAAKSFIKVDRREGKVNGLDKGSREVPCEDVEPPTLILQGANSLHKRWKFTCEFLSGFALACRIKMQASKCLAVTSTRELGLWF